MVGKKPFSIMRNTKLITTLTSTENFVGLYRNYAVLSKRGQRFAILHVTVNIMLLIFGFIYSLCTFFNLLSASKASYNAMVLHGLYMYIAGISISKILYSVTMSESYHFLLKYLSDVHNLYEDDLIFIEDSKSLYTFTVFNIGLFFIIRFVISIIRIVIRLHDKHYEHHITLQWLLTRIFEISCHWRFNTFFIMLCALMMTVHNLLKCLNKSVYDCLKNVEQQTVRKKITSKLDDATIQQWSFVYNNLVFCSKLVNVYFSKQILFVLMFYLFHAILIIYCIIDIEIKKAVDENFDHMDLISLSFSMLLASYVLVAAQKIHNQTTVLKRTLCKLHSFLTCSPDSEECRSVKDFHRLVSTKPVLLELTSTVPLKASLLLVAFSICSSYTIMLLQLNSIV